MTDERARTRPRPPAPAPDPARDAWRAGPRAKALEAAPERRERFETSSGIEIADVYTAADLAGFDPADRARPARRVPVHPGRPADDVPEPVLDDAPVRRLRHGQPRRTSASATCSSQGQTGLSVAFDLPTQMGYDSDAPAGRGRGRPGRRPDQQPGRHGDAVPGHPARRGQHLDDDQLDGPDPARPVRRRRRAPGRRPGRRQRDDPERHPQGVHRPGDLDLPAAAVDAPGHRRVRVLRPGAAPLEHDLDQRLPHARGRGDRRPGARLHPGRRDRLLRRGGRPGARHRRLRRPAELLLRRLERAVRGGRQVPGRPPDVGPDRPRAVRLDATRARRPAASTSRRPARA